MFQFVHSPLHVNIGFTKEIGFKEIEMPLNGGPWPLMHVKLGVLEIKIVQNLLEPQKSSTGKCQFDGPCV